MARDGGNREMKHAERRNVPNTVSWCLGRYHGAVKDDIESTRTYFYSYVMLLESYCIELLTIGISPSATFTIQ
jgi:hypothetical protein